MKHILMVDDVTTNLKSAAEVLQPFYQLSMAKSGKQALQFLKKNTPDLILLDLMMPEMNGYEVMEQIRLNPQTANIPIIFLTADTETSSEMKGLQMGAMDYITKPFESEVMLGRIEKVLLMEDMRKNLLGDLTKDSLTGVLTKDSCIKQVEKMMRQREGEKVHTVVLIDPDNLKKINDVLGLPEGDRLLAELGEVITTSFEKNEKWKDGIAGRIRGGEFMMYIPDRIEKEEISEWFHECLSSITGLSFSVAVVYVTPEANNYDELYRKLLMAMYHVKQSGKDNWHIYREK